MRPMRQDVPAFSGDFETVAELRELYRAAEARAARLRLLSNCGSDLVDAHTGNLEAVLERCASRLALFLGSRSATVRSGASGNGFPVAAPGARDLILARITVEGIDGTDAIGDPEDRDACIMLLDMMGGAIDRIERERELQRVLGLVRERENRLEHLVGKIFSAQEEERRRVAYELHDGVAQTATALVRMLEGAKEGGPGAIDRDGRGGLTGIARSLVTELRGVIAGLRPTILDDLGLVPAIEALADGLETEGYTVTRSFEVGTVRFAPYVETALYRVAQEAISNIQKHAGGACPVLIVADFRDGADRRFLRIADSGCGPSPDNRGRKGQGSGYHVGIEGMKERMATIGGDLIWRPRKEGGVLVEARLKTVD